MFYILGGGYTGSCICAYRSAVFNSKGCKICALRCMPDQVLLVWEKKGGRGNQWIWWNINGSGGHRIIVHTETKIAKCLPVPGCVLLPKHISAKEVEWHLREQGFETSFINADWCSEALIPPRPPRHTCSPLGPLLTVGQTLWGSMVFLPDPTGEGFTPKAGYKTAKYRH